MYHLKFYADCPSDGERNKLFCYSVYDGKHACDLLARFVSKDFRLRAAFMGLPGTKGEPLAPVAVKFPASVGAASSTLVKFPPLTDNAAPTTKELDELVAVFPHLRAAVDKLRAAA
jgi:hypothetical protein